MTFLNPVLAAAGLACVAIPILIHILMRRRRRPVPWGAMKFLLEAYRRQRRRTNLEQILLLAARCLIVALLAVAVGKPVLAAAGLLGVSGPRTLYLVIDNSLTSSATGAEAQARPELESLKDSATRLLGLLDGARGDRAALVTLAGPADPLVLPPTSDIAAVGELVRDLKPAASRSDMPGAVGRIADDLRQREHGAATVAVLSSFRAGAADVGTTLPSLGLESGQLALLATAPAATPLQNVSIVAVEPSRAVLIAPAAAGADETADVAARVVLRRSGESLDQALSVKILLRAVTGAESDRPGGGEGIATFAAGQASTNVLVTTAVPLRAASRGRVMLTASIDRDALETDNLFRRPMDVRERLEVVVLSPSGAGAGSIDAFTPADWLSLALAPEAETALRRRQGADLRLALVDPARSTAGVVGQAASVLIPRPDLLDAAGWQDVRNAADAGTVVVVFPPPDAQTHTWADAFTSVMKLDWTFPREARPLTPPRSITARRDLPPDHDLLALIAPELADLARPVRVSRVLSPEVPRGGGEPLLELDDASPLIIAGTPGQREGDAASPRGLVIYVAAAMDLAWTDLPAKPLMVPMMQEMVRQGVGRAVGSHVAAAGTIPTFPPGARELVPLAEGAGPVSLDGSGRPAPPVRGTGAYLIRNTSGASLGTVGFNADPAGGDVQTRSGDVVSRWLSGLGTEPVWITERTALTASGGGPSEGERPPVSLPLLIAALALAGVEAVMARAFSHAGTRELAAGSSNSSGAKAA